MKKFLILSVVLVGLVTLLLVRGHTQFPDRQLHGVEPLPQTPVDAEAMAQRLAGAIRIPTIAHDDRSNFDEAAFLDFHRYLEQHYPLIHAAATREVINGYSLVYRIDGHNAELKPALFMGHIDVVPVDPATIDEWIHGPFSGAIDQGIVWGRGAVDDKLTVMALMEAMELMLAAGEKPQRTVYFSFGHDEEVGGKDGAGHVAEHFKAQGISFEFVLDEGGAVTQGLVAGVEAPVAMIGIAEKGYMNLHLTVNASGGHSSQPPPHTAAGILAAAIVKVEDNPFPADLSALEPNFYYMGHYFPYSTRVALANTWLLSPLVEQVLLASRTAAPSIRTTTAVTMLEGSSKSNILPTRATAVVNFRILPGDSVAGVKQHIVDAIDDERVEVTVHMANEPSPVSSTESFGYKLLERTIRGSDGEVLVTPYLVQGGTDAKHFVDLSDSVYRFMMFRVNPMTAKRVHGVNEQVSVDHYVEAVRFYHALLSNLGDSPAS
ncbi:MAG: M20 family peptidase [Halieaceae bacterium]|nr:M20 family peptidase [Halieaceae bacterium]